MFNPIYSSSTYNSRNNQSLINYYRQTQRLPQDHVILISNDAPITLYVNMKKNKRLDQIQTTENTFTPSKTKAILSRYIPKSIISSILTLPTG